MTSASCVVLFGTTVSINAQTSSFVNWESPHVSPIALSPSGALLAAVNTADNRVELFSVDSLNGSLTPSAAIDVGLDPVSARFRTNTELWVVNHISDSVSVIDTTSGKVVRTIATADEPADVVFATTSELGLIPVEVHAFVSCSQADTIQVFDVDTGALFGEIAIQGEDPRALCVSADGRTVYAAIFESANGTTILAGDSNPPSPSQAVNNPGVNPYWDDPSIPGDERDPLVAAMFPTPTWINPPPNTVFLPGDQTEKQFSPAISAFNPATDQAPNVGLIVRKQGTDWVDDNGVAWTDAFSLPAGSTDLLTPAGRIDGWDLLDHDVAVIDADGFDDSGPDPIWTPTYAGEMLNAVMAIGIRPDSGSDVITVVGTDAINEVRYEPNLNGRFLRVLAGGFAQGSPSATGTSDVNTHLSYPAGPSFTSAPQSVREQSVGDPRAITWINSQRGFVAGMGSNNLIEIEPVGGGGAGDFQRVAAQPVEVGEGPTGLVADASANRLYVMNKFSASITVLDTTVAGAASHVQTVDLFDPTPDAITEGRKFLYDTHEFSGLGYVSCASCHIDGRTDRLAWDLGNPAGVVEPFQGNCVDVTGGCKDFHPMKGPMLTQTLQDIIGKEPHHWRGDRTGIEHFNGAYHELLGADIPVGNVAVLDAVQMQQFEDFLATIYYPPNPYRNLDNSLSSTVSLEGHWTTPKGFPGAPAVPGQDPLGDSGTNTASAIIGRELYTDVPGIALGGRCATCHTIPTGAGRSSVPDGMGGLMANSFPSPNGEEHLLIHRMDSLSNVSFKVPQLRNLYERTGYNHLRDDSVIGFGYSPDGHFSSLEAFVSQFSINLGTLTNASVQDDQETLAAFTAFLLSFAGSESTSGDIATDPIFGTGPLPVGVNSNDSHAAVGYQTTLTGGPLPTGSTAELEAEVFPILERDKMAPVLDLEKYVGLVARGTIAGERRGWAWAEYNVLLAEHMYRSDTASEPLISHADLVLLAQDSTQPDNSLTFTVVPDGTGDRIGIDRDEDGALDYDELHDPCGADWADPASTPRECVADVNQDGQLSPADYHAWILAFNTQQICGCDQNGDGACLPADFNAWLNNFNAGCP